ncbi:flagella basal body P-ring formation protein FlgA [Thalassotalea insulae]|uniref:Flagella basal body P-ring formation protein FlgA n=1 Tax=Thalassotalea insulae TaxID=2056778 RepID=A0ABQ6GP52_9GAMM|nr:flagellar basal body P-ring formation chaperone FlgA [Thalassotalea insulae]GLX77666.1 flagella basal body P-ring formation protein FlgA [Thalassotalea insulae]
MSKLKIFITFSLLLPVLASSNAKSYSADDVINFAKAYVEQNIEQPANGKIQVTPATIDPRITIKPCSVPLSANIPENYSSRNLNVKISCESSTPWQLFLPVKVETTVPVLVSNGKIAKGSILSNDNIRIEWHDLYRIRGEVIDEPSKVLGARTKRTLTAGAIITNKVICVVCKGETVTISAESDSFIIKTSGIALKNATFDEQVRVRNSRSGKVITAQVKSINQVVINL